MKFLGFLLQKLGNGCTVCLVSRIGHPRLGRRDLRWLEVEVLNVSYFRLPHKESRTLLLSLSLSLSLSLCVFLMTLAFPGSLIAQTPTRSFPPALHIVYNAGGDHQFRALLGALPKRSFALKRRSSDPLAPTPFTQVTITGSTNPLLQVYDISTAPANTGYLTQIQALNSTVGSGLDPNTPLEIISQANTTAGGGGVLPALAPAGFGGIDILQNAAATGTTGTSVMNVNSPQLRICAQAIIGSPAVTNADCWIAQVSVASLQGPNAQDIFTWSRPSGMFGNSSGNITMMFPKAINLAAPGQMTVGPSPAPTTMPDVSGVLSTFTGQKSTATGSGGTPKAGSITVQPGLLTALSLTGTDAQEGGLQILQGYISMSTADSTPPTPGLLACPGGVAAPQTATNCTTTGPAEN